MTYDLYIGDKTFSSWSLRGWLMLETFELPYQEHMVGLYAGTLRDDLSPYFPARTVPALVTPEGYVLSDSLAMAETLAERHGGLWPTDDAARAFARSIVAEVHSGFAALRDACPMNLAHCWDGFEASSAVREDVERIEELWSHARSKFGQGGPYLFGDWTLADCFYAPVATRLVTYKLTVGSQTQGYIDHILAHPALNAWRDAGLTVTYDPMPYDQGLPKVPWPGN